MKTIKILLTVFSLTGFSLFAQDLPDPQSIFEESRENPIQIINPYDASEMTASLLEQRNMRRARAIREAYSKPEGLSEDEAKRAILTESWHGNVDAVKILLENGVDPNTTEIGSDRTPLLKTVNRFAGIGVMELLIQSGAEIEAQDYNGESPLFKAAQRRNPLQVDYLLASKANPNTVSKDGRLLMEAIRNGGAVIRNLALQNGARNKRTIETTKDVLYVTKALISHGADMGPANNRTALTTCAESCCPPSLLFILLKSGADEYIDSRIVRQEMIQNISGQDEIVTSTITAKEIALSRGCYPVASILEKVETERESREIPAILEDLRATYSVELDLASI